MTPHLKLGLFLAACAAAHPAIAQQTPQEQSPWLVRLRAVHIAPADKSEPIGGTGPADLITVTTRNIAEIDVSYFFTPNIAAEVIFGARQKHAMYLGSERVGSFKHLAPTVLVQYHFRPTATLRPYLGLGINHTRISNVDLLGGAGSVEDDSTGPALQAGLDIQLDRNWFLNLDVKKLWIRSDVFVGGARVSHVRVDPTLWGVGVGYRF
ncbi:OmpW family protein [Ramlibacter sp. AW1]|uniref:OmpW family protein n=1 Tax=Ramlibacter aurantiacus TaxID=2801330 RepID=A0A937D3C7_9BURK|nr:OmpW family outer membrane protein [Ramlibacter aurantiacus]MBL0420590.1 OmpW family protein [Ramlibacter aurantiacus]